MIGLQPVTIVKKRENALTSITILASWQGAHGIKAAALGQSRNDGIIVRIPDTSVDVAVNDILILGSVDATGQTEKQLYTDHAGYIVRATSVNRYAELSEAVNHIEVVCV